MLVFKTCMIQIRQALTIRPYNLKAELKSDGFGNHDWGLYFDKPHLKQEQNEESESPR